MKRKKLYSLILLLAFSVLMINVFLILDKIYAIRDIVSRNLGYESEIRAKGSIIEDGIIAPGIHTPTYPSMISFQGSMKFAHHIDILRRSQTGPWTTGITSWGGTAETNYINPSWYGPTVSWRGYVRAQAGTCCWATGSDVRRLHIRFNNINTGQATNEISTTGYLRDVWDLGTVSDAGYWQVQVYSDDGCGWAGTWWCPIPRIWEGTMIAIVTT